MIYKYCPPNQYSLQNLENRQIICRHFGDFNDPFEFWSKHVEGIPRQSEKERLAAALVAWGFPDPSTAEPHEEYFDSLVSAQPPFRLLYDFTRIACFGVDKTSLLLWSHYADGLLGFCIGFDDNEIATNAEHYMTDVEYAGDPPIVDSFLYAVAEDQWNYNMTCIEDRPRNEAYFGRDSVSDDDYQAYADEALQLMKAIWRRAFAIKPMDWSYEREKRLLIRTDKDDLSPIFLEYPAGAIKEIVLGERMSPEYREKLLRLVGQVYPKAEIEYATRTSAAYRLELIKLPYFAAGNR